jgi:hypothetical protein
MPQKRKQGSYYDLDELIDRLEDFDEVNMTKALLGICYEIRELIQGFNDYMDQEREYDP